MQDPSTLFRLDGRVAVVTGASAGIGTALAEGLAAAGARVVLAARRAERLEELAGRLAAEGAEALAVACDVSAEPEVDRLVEATLRRFGRVDVLVNNAGIVTIVPAEDEPLEEFRRTVDVNLIGVFLCAQRFGRVMLEAGRGSIVNVASVLGLVGSGQVKQAAYCAAKGGVMNLTRALAQEWGGHGVTVNCIAPGWLEDSPGLGEPDPQANRLIRFIPMRRPGHADEVAPLALWLASEASGNVSGQTFFVDGGLLCHL